jgi:hypothetical protein
MVADHGLNRVQAIGHKAFAAGEATPSSVQPAQVPGVYPEVAGLKENHPDADVAIVSIYSDPDTCLTDDNNSHKHQDADAFTTVKVRGRTCENQPRADSPTQVTPRSGGGEKLCATALELHPDLCYDRSQSGFKNLFSQFFSK